MYRSSPPPFIGSQGLSSTNEVELCRRSFERGPAKLDGGSTAELTGKCWSMKIVEQRQLDEIRHGEIPRHVACIMDGNGRWALARSFERSDGHRAAEQAVNSTIDAALELGIEWLTLYAFSTENWNRPRAEVEFLMRFEEWLFRRDRRDQLISQGVSFRIAGRIGPEYEGSIEDGKIPRFSREYLMECEELSRDQSRLKLCIAFNYGGRFELEDAIRKIVSEGGDVSQERIAGAMYIPDMPDMDLIIRTSNEERLSNFFPWHSSPAEFLFIDTLWPDFRGWHLYSAVSEYQQRNRRKGKPETTYPAKELGGGTM
jgi:undecaprenyl diphosphate synthase